MKKALIISIAAVLMAAPMAQAQSKMDHTKRQTHSQSHADYKKQAQTQLKKTVQHRAAAKKHWAKGQRMNDWSKHSPVRDYKRHGLRKPGHGQSWVKVDNQYVLISVVSGLIAGIVAAQ